MRMEEQELMRLVQSGDEMAFGKIVRIYKDRIVNFLWQMTGDYQKASDLAQETFIRVFFKANKYKPIAPVSSWIYTIASNLGRTELKKMRRVNTVAFEEVQNFLADDSSMVTNPVDVETFKSLREAINSLPSRYRIPVILKDMEGFSQEEIAQILKRPVGTIKARISRGRNYLKKEMENKMFRFNEGMKKEEDRNG